MPEIKQKYISAGGVVIKYNDTSPEPLFCIILPSNNWGPWTWPKGRRDEGEGLQTTALREVREESGIIARIIPNGYLGMGYGKESITHYWLMECISDTGQHDFETEQVKFATYQEAKNIFSSNGSARDLDILKKAYKKLQALHELRICNIIRTLLV